MITFAKIMFFFNMTKEKGEKSTFQPFSPIHSGHNIYKKCISMFLTSLPCDH